MLLFLQLLLMHSLFLSQPVSLLHVCPSSWFQFGLNTNFSYLFFSRLKKKRDIALDLILVDFSSLISNLVFTWKRYLWYGFAGVKSIEPVLLYSASWNCWQSFSHLIPVFWSVSPPSSSSSSSSWSSWSQQPHQYLGLHEILHKNMKMKQHHLFSLFILRRKKFKLWWLIKWGILSFPYLLQRSQHWIQLYSFEDNFSLIQASHLFPTGFKRNQSQGVIRYSPSHSWKKIHAALKIHREMQCVLKQRTFKFQAYIPFIVYSG